MRNLAWLTAIPLVFGCAQQSALRAPALPSNGPLQVRLFQPAAGALNYQLSEPAYVAIFAVTRGHGISMIFPHYASQADHPSPRGLNRETVHGGSGAWGYSTTARNEHRALFGFADAYYVIASRYPLPVDGLVQSPWLLRSLMGGDGFRATNLSETWAALEAVLVEGTAADAWSSDVYLNLRDPFLFVGAVPNRLFSHCSDLQSFYGSTLSSNYCRQNPVTVLNRAPVPVANGTMRSPPAEPRDRNPHLPLNPPSVGADAVVARASATSDSAIPRGEPRRREPSRPAETRPQPPPSPDEPDPPGQPTPDAE